MWAGRGEECGIDTGDIREKDKELWKNAVLVMPDKTRPVTLRIKESVVAAFRQENPKGYQTRMNAVLETYAREVLAKKPA
jgi:uncharacterized protein (DUF4415 family)